MQCIYLFVCLSGNPILFYFIERLLLFYSCFELVFTLKFCNFVVSLLLLLVVVVVVVV